MFDKIMIPVDLKHIDGMQKSLEVTAGLAKQYDATVHYVTVAGRVPNRAARTPEELARHLADFARQQGEEYGIKTDSRTMDSTDVTIELDDKLVQAQKEIGADLVVMASHIPGVADRLHLISSNAGELAQRLPVSVFILR
ncbi:universal stress protein [Thioalkalivibrio sp.]|uniref:universal stress protein n=1 Tax=Thioalkalivibrio sp. TaxID=2093813 RepID=UPI0035697270